MRQKKKKYADETLNIIKKILNYNKDAQKNFLLGSKVDKGKWEPKLEESIAESVKLRRQRLDIINKKKENINNKLFNHYFSYLNPSIILERLRDASDERNKDMVESINKTLPKMKNIVKNLPKDKVSRVEENKKIIDIVESLVELNSENQLGLGLKGLTPNQILSRLPISLAQLKAGNNSEKLKSKMRQILYSLYRSKKLTNQLYKSLIDII